MINFFTERGFCEQTMHVNLFFTSTSAKIPTGVFIGARNVEMPLVRFDNHLVGIIEKDYVVFDAKISHAPVSHTPMRRAIGLFR